MSDPLHHDLHNDRRASAMGFTLKAAAIAAVFFAGVLPTLSWLEFSSGSENLVVETVLEMRRGGPWLIPTLKGAPRTAKPPLTAWISAALLKPATVTALADVGQPRERAYRQLAWEIRWPALLFSCLTLLACAWLGRVIFDDDGIGLAAAAMMGSSLMFLRFGRTMTTDVQLGLWVTMANAAFALALLRGRTWIGCLGGGAALGLALMSKGPVAIAQTIAPFIVVAIWNRWRPSESQPRTMRRIRWSPLVAAAIVTLAIALPWPIYTLARLPGQIAFWWAQITGGGGREEFSADPPWTYLALIPLLMPWTGLFVIGMIDLFRRRTAAARLAIALVVVPLLIMTCFAEKNERYLLPMLAPAAVVCAIGIVRREDDEPDPIREWVVGLTWPVLTAIVLGACVGGAFLKKVDQTSYWSLPTGLMLAAAAAVILIVAWMIDRMRGGRAPLLVAGAVLMIATQALFMHGYADSRNGRSDGKPLADAIVNTLGPGADVRTFVSPGRFFRVPVDFVIYLNGTTEQASDPTTLPSVAPRPRAIIVHCRKETDRPAELADWRVIGQISKNSGTWYACVPPSR
jgi:4-amino-4-deoxy-L-arabinose transferase-like glycosyltransferase